MIFIIENYWMAKRLASHIYQALGNFDTDRNSQLNQLCDVALIDLKDKASQQFFEYFQKHRINADFHLDFANDNLIVSVFTGLPRGTLAISLGEMFGAFWSDYVLAYFTDRTQNALSQENKAQNLYLLSLFEKVEFFSLWQFLLSKHYEGKKVTGDLFIQFQVSDSGIIENEGLDHWLGLTDTTGFEVVKNNPNGRNGKPYRNIRIALENFRSYLKVVAPSFSHFLHVNVLFREYVLENDIMRSENDSFGLFRYFEENTISPKEVKNYLAKHGLTGIQAILEPKKTEVAQTLKPFFVAGFEPSVSWF